MSNDGKRGARAYRLGLRAEALCRVALRLKLYRIVDSRFKTAQGEIDLVAARGKTLAFIEVKARPDEASATEAVSPRQRQRLARAAKVFLGRNPRFAGHALRFDIMSVSPGRWPKHIENAFFGE